MLLSWRKKVTFPYEVTQNITLYAKWGENLPTSISFVVSAEGVLTEVNGISETNNVVIIPNQVNNIEVKEIKKIPNIKEDTIISNLNLPGINEDIFIDIDGKNYIK